MSTYHDSSWQLTSLMSKQYSAGSLGATKCCTGGSQTHQQLVCTLPRQTWAQLTMQIRSSRCSAGSKNTSRAIHVRVCNEEILTSSGACYRWGKGRCAHQEIEQFASVGLKVIADTNLLYMILAASYSVLSNSSDTADACRSIRPLSMPVFASLLMLCNGCQKATERPRIPTDTACMTCMQYTKSSDASPTMHPK